jgi:hypothetical protein
MQKLMLDALDCAISQHVVKLFNVFISDPNDEALHRFETGIGRLIAAHRQLRDAITGKCNNETS